MGDARVMRTGGWARLCSGALLVVAAGCGLEDASPPAPEKPARPEQTGRALARAGFHEEPRGIASSWYDYDGTTHSVSPRPVVFGWRTGARLALFEVVSYYDARGTSGLLALRGQVFDGQAWDAVTTLTLTANIKQQPACLRLAPLAEVPCDAAPDQADLVARIAWRALPDGGFAVADPSLLATARVVDGEAPELFEVQADALEDAVALGAAALRGLDALPDADREPAHGLVGWLHEPEDDTPYGLEHVQVTGTMQAARWRVLGLTRDDAQLTITAEVTCQRVNYADQLAFDDATARTITVTLPRDAPHTAALVRWCDPDAEAAAVAGEVVARRAGAWGARWPEALDTRGFDVSVEQRDGRAAILVAPGNLLWSWAPDGARLTSEATMWEDGL